MSGQGIIRFECSVCEHYKTCLKDINYDEASKCSSKAEQRKIKQEVEQDDRNT